MKISLRTVAAAAALTLCDIALLACVVPDSRADAATLTANTSKPNISTFAKDEPVTLTFNVAGLSPGQSTMLTLEYRNEYGKTVLKDAIPVTATAEGTWAGSEKAPSDHYAFYRVYGALTDGTVIAALSSRPAGYITYSVVPDPATRVAYSAADSMFGMQGGFSEGAPVIPYLGVRWTAGDWGWPHNEADHPGQFDELFAKAKAKGQTFPWQSPATEQVTYAGKPYQTYTLATMNGAPKWAALKGFEAGNSVLNDVGEAGWSRYGQEVGEAFPSNYPAQSLHPYQLTWEPFSPLNWKGTDEQLIRIYQIGYAALHKSDPHATVIGPTNGWASDEIGLFKAGLANYIDGYSVHPYCAYPPEPNGYLDRIRSTKQILRQYSNRDIAIYGTEQGHTTGGKVDDELVQAMSNVRDNLISLGEGMTFNYAFYVADYPGEPGYGYYYNLDPNVAFGSGKVAPKPTVPAYAAMTYLIDGHRPSQTIEWLGVTTLGYAFQRGADIVLALWDYSGTPNTVTFPVGVPTVEVYDWMGNGHATKTTANGRLTLTLGPAPIYVKGVSPTLWGRTAQRPLTLDRTKIVAFPGSTVLVGAKVAVVSDRPGIGKLMLEPGAGLLGLETEAPVKLARSPVHVDLPLRLPRDLPVGPYSAKVTLERDGTPIAATGVMLDVKAPVEVSEVVPVFRSGAPYVSATFTNQTPLPQSVTAELRLVGSPGDRPSARVNLPPGVSAVKLFDCAPFAPTGGDKYVARIKTTTAGGYTTSSDYSVTFAPVSFVTVPPALDAPLDSWSALPAITVAGRSHVIRSTDYYNGKLAVSAKFAWDSTNLYVAFDVTDPVYIQTHTGWETWKGDCIQLEFNLDPDRKAETTGNLVIDAGMVRTSEIDIALTATGPEAYRTHSYSASQAPEGQLTQEQLRLKVMQTASGLQYRAAIPWKTLGANKAPVSGQRIGFSAFINDMNQPGQLDPTAIGLYAEAVSRDSSKFGTLVLLASGK